MAMYHTRLGFLQVRCALQVHPPHILNPLMYMDHLTHSFHLSSSQMLLEQAPGNLLQEALHCHPRAPETDGLPPVQHPPFPTTRSIPRWTPEHRHSLTHWTMGQQRTYQELWAKGFQTSRNLRRTAFITEPAQNEEATVAYETLLALVLYWH